MIKKWLAMILALAVAISLCACGKEDKKDRDDRDDRDNQTQDQEERPDVFENFSEETEPEAEEKKWVISRSFMQYSQIDRSTEMIYEYNSDGFLVKKTQVDMYDGEVTDKWVTDITPDERGEKRYSTSLSNGTQFAQYEYRTLYDAEGRVISVQTYEDGRCVAISEYNDRGDVVYYWSESETQVVTMTYEYQYDENGFLKMIINNQILERIDGEYTVTYYQRVECDELGRKIKAQMSDENGNEYDAYMLYEYDEHGNLCKESYYNSGELYSVTNYEYIEIG